MAARRLSALLVCLALCCPSFARAQEDDDEDEDDSFFHGLSIGLRGDMDKQANETSLNWGPTLNLDLLTSRNDAPNRFKYGIGYDYEDASSRLKGDGDGAATRVRTSEIKFAKLSFLRVGGFDFRKRLNLVPYVSSGIQYVDSRVDEDGERTNEFFWSPTLGAGLEFALNHRLDLTFDFNSNTAGGQRRITRFSLELKYHVFGETDD